MQYIPKYRLSGNIKHLFIDDVSNDSLHQHYDGVVNESTMSINIQSVHRDTLQEALFSIGGVPVLVYLFGLVSFIISLFLFKPIQLYTWRSVAFSKVAGLSPQLY